MQGTRRSICTASRVLRHGHGNHHHPAFSKTQGWRAVQAEEKLPTKGRDAEIKRCLELGLEGAKSIEDRTISMMSRGELPHFAGINTFMKAPYVEDMKNVGLYDAAVVGAPFDGGTTYRPGTRFGPQGIRKISALYSPYNFEMGVDLREQMTLCDVGDIFTIPANIEKTFDQISNAVGYIAASGAFPIVLGGDHSIGYPTVRGLSSVTSKRIGIIHFDRHADIQEKDMDERMHTTPYFHATAIPNVPASNLVQVGIGGWQVPREALPNMRALQTNVVTMNDIEMLGVEKVAEMALDAAWKDADAVWLSFDIDCIDAAFVPGTGWPEPGGLLPREALKLIGLIAKEGLCGMEVVEVSPPYDHADITALMALRIIVDTLGSMVAHGKLGAHKHILDKPWVPL
eukprot:TRINITY_DN9244_c0_g1_i1.p1 TRINITY_DN9244_c0_g1~~TRINITY_DN9244_c0_g1_i1.p1  ORF type:complete len:400 (-),score=73.26 TRINITY_DN9244_c0_g1_i1:182-1381(-)